METEPDLPIAISAVGNKYLLFDIAAVTWLRQHHQLCGAFVGTLPQNPAQNVFLGLPVQIMPEEAQLLVEKGVGHIVDEAQAHESAMKNANKARQADYLANLRQNADEISAAKAREREQDRQKKMVMNRGKTRKKQQQTRTSPATDSSETLIATEPESILADDRDDDESTSLFDSTSTIRQVSSKAAAGIAAAEPRANASLSNLYVDHSITPTTSKLLLPSRTTSSSSASTSPSPSPSSFSSSETIAAVTTPGTRLIPGLPSSYPLYRHLNSHSYFVTPGLRFGCQYCVYPGDPLRFHSHFLAIGFDWDEEIDLMDIVAGGRLGTGVKKGLLIGGAQPREVGRRRSVAENDDKEKVKTWTIEWAAM